MGTRSNPVPAETEELTDEEKKKKKESEAAKKATQFKNVMAAIQAARVNPAVGTTGDHTSRVTQLGAQGQAAVSQGALSGAMTGAQLGGPVGGAIGAGVGVLQGAQKRKQSMKAIDAATTQRLGDVRKKEQEDVRSILGGIINNLRNIL